MINGDMQLERGPFPSEFVRPMVNAQGHLLVTPGDSATTLRPIFGTVNGQFVRFFIHREYNARMSIEVGHEVLDEIEMVECINDKMTRMHKRVCEMSQEQKQKWGAIYENFKKQIQLDGTPIDAWLAVSEYQKALLTHCGVMSVEQLAALSPEGMARLGPDGKELQEKAQAHLSTKQNKYKAEELAEEMRVMRETIESERKAMREKEEAMYARIIALEAAKAAPKKSPGRPKREVTITEEVA